MYGYLKQGSRNPMAQGRSTTIVSMIKWIRTIRSSTNNSLSDPSTSNLQPVVGQGTGISAVQILISEPFGTVHGSGFKLSRLVYKDIP